MEKNMEKPQEIGPFLDETQLQQHAFDLEKLPAELRQIRSYIIADRDSKKQYEVMIEWGNIVIYRDENVSAYARIVELLKNGKYSIETRGNKLKLYFSEEDFV